MDLARIKDCATALLYTDIHPTPFSPLVVHHPFTASGVTAIHENGELRMLNLVENEEDLRAWRANTEKLISDAEDFHLIFVMVNQPYRLLFLRQIMSWMKPEEFGEYLSFAYISDEYPSENIAQKQLLEMFRNADQRSLMTEEELAVLEQLPDKLEIYRGVQTKSKKYVRGTSWTLDPQKAKWFAQRFNSDGLVYVAEVEKSKVFAYYNGRDEKEIVVDPKHLRNLREISTTKSS